MSADRILLGVMGCLMLKYLADRQIAKLKCAYCGAVRGHEQDCPFDIDQR